MGIVGFSLRRRVTIAMCAVALILFGVVAFGRLPINLLPDLSYPSLTVETKLPGAAPSEVETLVTRPLEEIVGVVSGVQRLTSVSRPGLSQVTLEFGWGQNMDFASIDVREKLDTVHLPRETEKPVLLRFDPSNDPVARLFLTGGTDLYQLRYVAEDVLKKDLESTEGIAAIKVSGGYEDEIQVYVDEGKLSLLGLSIDEVNEKLMRENVNQAGGSLYEEEARYLVRANNEFQSLEDILDTVLVNDRGRQVKIGDVATVERGHKKREVITRFGGREAVELAIYKEGDANTVRVARALQARLGSVSGELPEGIQVVTGVDQSRFIEASIREVLANALIGGFFAILMLLFFLKDFRSTLIIGISIPISIVATFFLMYQTGTTLNIMSLGGLALGVGMLVDNAIVVLESIFRRREQGASTFEAARLGASEVGRAVIASTLTTVAVFLPVLFLEGVAAQLFLDMALTVSFSLLASLAVSLTLIPMLAALVGGGAKRVASKPTVPEGGRVRRVGRFIAVGIPSWIVWGLRQFVFGVGRLLAALAWPFTWLFDRTLGAVIHSYPGMLRWALRSRLAVIAVALLIWGGAVALLPRLGLDLVPQFSQGEFSFTIELPEGTPIEITDRFVADVQSVLEDDSRIETYSSMSGGAGLSLTNTGTEGENVARIQVRMKPETTRDDENAVAALLRDRLETSELAHFKFERPSYFSFRFPIEVEIYSDRLEELHAAASQVRDRIDDVSGLVDVKSSAQLGNPELQVAFNRDQIMALGLDVYGVASTIRNKVQGEVATRFHEGDREIDITVRSVQLGRASVSDVQEMIVGQRNGVPIYLKSVATVTLGEGPAEIRRIGQRRAAVVSGNLRGRDMGAVAADIRTELGGLALPGTVSAFLSGQEEEMSRSMRSLLLAMGLAIFLVYLVMASQFESFVHPFVIIFSLPLGAAGVVGALLLSGRSINIVAMIGMVMLAGIVVNNAIVLIDAINRRRVEGMPKHEAIVDAGKSRLRPILMTSATTILAMLPMAIGLGEGAELRSPLAITVIGGLAVATGLTLLVIPVIYSLLDRKVYAVDAGEILEAGTAAEAQRAEPLPLGVEAPEDGVMNLARLAVARPITTVMILVCVLVIGGIAMSRLPLAYLPEVDAPFIWVEVPYPNSNPIQIEREIARPVEEVLATLPGLKTIRSQSSADEAGFGLEFTWGEDLDIVRMQVSEKMDQIRPSLPPDIGEVLIYSFNTSEIPVIEGRIAARGVDLSSNYDLLEARVINPIRRVAGVARVDLNGVEPREISIDLVLAAIKQHNVDVGALIRRLNGAASNLVLGQVDDAGLRYSARSLGSFDSVEAIGDFPVDATGLKLRDIAEIEYEEPPLAYGRHLDREYAIAVEVFKESTANTVEVVRNVTRVIEDDINNDPLLQGVQLFVWENQAEHITQGLSGLRKAGLLGAMMAIFVLYFFLRRMDSTLIVSLSIPFSVIAACGVMHFLGKSLNLLSMMGLMLGVGMLVDNAIVVLESIDRRHADEPDTKKAALEGARSVTMAVVASTLTSLIVFLPLILGNTELTVWLGEVGITISLALICSLVSSLLLIPLMSAHLLREKRTEPRRAVVWLEKRYVGLLDWTLRHRVWTGVILVAALGLGLTPLFAGWVETAMFSAHVNKRLYMAYEFDDYHYKSEAEVVVNQIEEYLYAHQEEFLIESVYSFYTANYAGSTMILTREDMLDDEIKELRGKIRDGLPEIPGVRFHFDDDADEGGSSMRFAVKFFGQDSGTLRVLAEEAERRLETLEGVQDLSNSFRRGRKEIQVRIDREKAAHMGLTAQDVSEVFAFTLGGTRLPRFNAGEREVETWLALRLEDRTNLNDLKQLQFGIGEGRTVKLGDIADFEIVQRPEWLIRENRKVRVAVYAAYEGEEWEPTRQKISELMDSLEMPPGYSWTWNDRILEQDDQDAQMGVNFLLAILLVYLVMASLFESLAQPFAILFSILFALPGTAWMLLATDTPFNLMSQIGLLILMGIVVNNGIVLLDCMNQYRHAGLSKREAILRAGRDRMRPILMTASTTVTGLIPLALGGSTVGGLFYFPLARTVMGGLISSAVFTLLALPSLTLAVEGIAAWFRRIWTESRPRRVAQERLADAA